MKKRILILEPSKTLEEIIKERLSSIEDVALEFLSDGLSFLQSAKAGGFAAFLLNAKAENPAALELAGFIKSLDGLKEIPLAFYASEKFLLKGFYSERVGGGVFLDLQKPDFALKVKSLFPSDDEDGEKSEEGKDKNKKKENLPQKYFVDSGKKEALLLEIFESVRSMQSIEKMSGAVLRAISCACGLVAAGIILRETERIKEYFLCSKNFTPEEKKDFLKVCADDFKSQRVDAEGETIAAENTGCDEALNAFRKEGSRLSSYQSAPLLDERGNSFGLLCVVKEGNVTEEESSLISFCAARASLSFECALFTQKKLYFERRIRKAFSRFVPEQIIDDLVKEAGSGKKVAVGEKRNVAILFSDIRSFTNISELNRPETIVAFLNRYFTIMVNIIKKHGGTIDKFIGDAIMALFGAPISYEDNSRRAVAAACEMREALATVPMEDLLLPDGMKFNIGIGINYGDVIVGSIGSSDKTDYSVIGDNVNLASRMEGLTKTYGAMILVSDSVKSDIKENEFVFRYLDDVKVKGKAKSVSIYAVDKSIDEFSAKFRDSYSKGMDLYRQGIWNLAAEYFEKALSEVNDDKAALLMLDRCKDFEKNPPENWNGAITFHTK